eukprot:4668494-Pleurochrysis_carterae.AAC.2
MVCGRGRGEGRQAARRTKLPFLTVGRSLSALSYADAQSGLCIHVCRFAECGRCALADRPKTARRAKRCSPMRSLNCQR